MGEHSYFSYNLKDKIEFEVNVNLKKVGSASQDPTSLILSSSPFTLSRDEYDCGEKPIYLVDGREATEGRDATSLAIFARIRKTEQTRLEITFYSKHTIINNTD